MIVIYQDQSSHRWLHRAYLLRSDEENPPVCTRCGAERRSEADEATECKKQRSVG